jgi:hypothetical protein
MAIKKLRVTTEMDNKGLKKGVSEAKKSLGGMESATARMSKSMRRAFTRR